MEHDSTEVEVADGPQKGAGGGGVPIGSVIGRGGRKHVSLTKVSKGLDKCGKWPQTMSWRLIRYSLALQKG